MSATTSSLSAPVEEVLAPKSNDNPNTLVAEVQKVTKLPPWVLSTFFEHAQVPLGLRNKGKETGLPDEQLFLDWINRKGETLVKMAWEIYCRRGDGWNEKTTCQAVRFFQNVESYLRLAEVELERDDPQRNVQVQAHIQKQALEHAAFMESEPPKGNVCELEDLMGEK